LGISFGRVLTPGTIARHAEYIRAGLWQPWRDCHACRGCRFHCEANVSLYWLTYSVGDRVHGVVVREAADEPQACIRANINRLDQGPEFAAGCELDDEQAALVPQDMLGRMLSPHEAHELIDRIECGIA